MTKRIVLFVLGTLLLAACATNSEPTSPPPVASESSITSSASTVVSGDKVTVTVQLRSADGKKSAVAGHSVAFYSTAGTLAGKGLTPSAAGPTIIKTNEQGSAVVTLTHDSAGIVKITAFLGQDDSSDRIGEIKLTFAANDNGTDPDEDPGEDPGEEEPTAAEASTSTITAANDKAVIGGRVAVTVQIKDAEGNELARAGESVTFTSSADTLVLDDNAPTDTVSVTTDATGAASTITTSPRAGTFVVNAYLGSDDSAPMIGSVDVEFASLAMNDLVVTYNGQPQELVAEFSNEAAAVGATYEYRNATTGEVLSGVPSDVGSYEVSVAPGAGFPGSASATLSIEPVELGFVGTVSFADKAYDGGSAATAAATLDTTNVVTGDAVALKSDRAGEFQVSQGGLWVPSSNAGTYLNDGDSRVIGTLKLEGADAHNYFIEQPLGAATINPRTLAFAGGASVADKTYDGTTSASVSGVLEPAPLQGDDVDFDGTFAVKNVAVDVAVAVTLVGDDAANYVLTVATPSAEIRRREVTVTAGDQSKVYGDPAELGSATFTVDNLVEGEAFSSVTLTSTGSAAAVNVGTYPVDAADAVAAEGTLLTNYDISYVSGTLNVVARELTITPAAAQSKSYGVEEPVLAYTPSGLVNEDILTGELGRAEGEIVGDYSFTLGTLAVEDGNEGMNYTLGIGGEELFTVTARSVVVTPDSDQSKIYGDDDHAFTYTVPEGSLVDGDVFIGALGREEGDVVGSYTYSLGDLSVEDGNEGSNYELSLGNDSGDFAITARTLTVTGSFSVADREYDGTTFAEITDNNLELTNTVGGDDVTLAPVAAFNDRHVAEGKTVSLTDGSVLEGADADNYILDLTGSWSASADVSQAPITFDITNKDGMMYNGTARALVVVTDPVAAPAIEPVSYSLEYRRIATAAGDEIDEGVGSVRSAGQYRVKVTSTDARYVGQDEIIVTVGAQPITVTAVADSKTYGTTDPDLAPSLVDSTLAAGDALSGQLEYDGDDAGAYDLTIGSVAIVRGVANVSENYEVTVEGSFTIEPATVSFDIGNAQLVIDGVHRFEGNGVALVGLDIVSDPSGMTDYVLSYRRTHDELYQPIPSAQQPVSAIGALGTYEVTIGSLNPNYAGTSVRTVWVTDGFTFDSPNTDEDGQPLPVGAHIGDNVSVTVPILTSGGLPRALGPVDLTLDLKAEPESGLTFFDHQTGDPITSITVPAGATSFSFDVSVDALHTEAYEVSVVDDDWSDPAVEVLSFQVVAQAQLVVLGTNLEVGEDAASTDIFVQLQDSNGLPVEAPAVMTLNLVGVEGLAFLASATDDVITGVTIPNSSTSTSFRVRSGIAGDYAFHIDNGSSVPGIIKSTDRTVTVYPKPAISSVSPASLEIGATTEFVITGANFVEGAIVAVDGLAVSGVSIDSDSQVTVSVTAVVGDTEGAKTVYVTNADGGVGSLAAGLEVVKPTLSATADVVNIVEDGSIDLAEATLLTNDLSSSGIGFSLVGVANAQNVTVVDNGATLRVTSTGLMENGASFDYTIEDVLGTQSTGTVTFNITLPPQDAVVFTDSAELQAYTAGYEPPTFQEVFNTWPRASNNNYYPDPSQPMGGNAGTWTYDSVNDRIVQPANTGPHEIIVSPESEALEYYEFEATLWSNDGDNDSIGLVIAFVREGSTNKYLVAHRTQSGNIPTNGWGISYFNGTSLTVLTDVSVDGTSTGWNGKSSRVRIVRNGDKITAWASAWDNLANFGGQMEIDLDANTINGTPVGFDLSVFKGAMQYGYYTQSQPYSTYLDIEISGGLARDLAYLLTSGSVTDGIESWTGSEVWQFNQTTLVWEEQAGRTIQDDLRFPRIVTSVAPDPAPDGPADGRRFEVREENVRLLNDE